MGSVHGVSVWDFCPGGSLTGGLCLSVSVLAVYVQGDLCPGWGLIPEGSLSREVCPWGLCLVISVQEGLYQVSLSRGSLSRGLCLGFYVQGRGSLSRGGGHCAWGLWRFLSKRVFIKVSLSRGSLSRGSLSRGGLLCPGDVCLGVYVEGVTVHGVSVWGLCPGEGSLSRRVSVQQDLSPGWVLSPEGSLFSGVCLGNLCPGCLCQRVCPGVSVQGWSVHGVSVQGVSV